MTQPSKPQAEPAPEPFEHPRGTLVIVLLFGLVFAIGWIAMYFYVFLGRGGVHS